MFQKPEKTLTHQKLILLRERKKLTPEEASTLKRLDSGHEGEAHFSQLLQKSVSTTASLFSINLEMNDSESQFDCIHMTHEKLYHFEIKNYKDDFYLKEDKWYHRASQKEIRNPLHQLKRSSLLLKEFLFNHNLSIPVKSLIVFIHPTFHLYQSCMNAPIIYHSQLHRFMNHLQTETSMQFSQQKRLKKLFEKNHKEVSKYDQMPQYDYNALKKGVYCKICYASINYLNKKQMYCEKCGLVENLSGILLRQIHTFMLLFPDKKLTVSNIYDWCGGLFSKKQIRRILSIHFTLVNRGRSSFYMA